MAVKIPIPARLAGRPTRGGVVVPWVSVVLADGTPVLGNLHGTKVDRALWERLCQICGEPLLGGPIVLFATESAHARGQTSEPGMHPECAAYSAKACPMVNGTMTRYLDVDRVAGKPCPDPACGCEGWVGEDTKTAGRAAEPWFAVWVRDYGIGIDPATRRANAAIYSHITPLKVRPLTTRSEAP